jgi:predicted amidohydrolase
VIIDVIRKKKTMKVALVVPKLTSDEFTNVNAIKKYIHSAADNGAQFVLFPEAALTGLVNNDDPKHDLPLGEPVPGFVTEQIGKICETRKVWTALGLLETDNGAMYDSAILIDPLGDIKMKYRRIQPQWHGKKADATVYRQGSHVEKAITPFGSVSFLICGDLVSKQK